MVISPFKLRTKILLVTGFGIVACLLAVVLGYKIHLNAEAHKTWTYHSYPNPMPNLEMGDGLPGPNGEPPATIRELVAPIKIVEACFYWDGGTIGVHLSDSVGTQVWISFPSPPEFENYPKGFLYNTLYVGALPDAPSSRLPVTKAEAYMLCRSLESALKDAQKEYDAINGNENHPKRNSRRYDDLAVSFNLLKQLKNCRKFHLEKDLRALEKKIRQGSE